MTPASIARTERPRVPDRDAELGRTEALPKVSGHATGVLVAVDKGWLAAVIELAQDGAAAVERLNNRIVAGTAERACTKAWLETGQPAPGCTTPIPTNGSK